MVELMVPHHCKHRKTLESHDDSFAVIVDANVAVGVCNGGIQRRFDLQHSESSKLEEVKKSRWRTSNRIPVPMQGLQVQSKI
jgi:hypothetical protein